MDEPLLLFLRRMRRPLLILIAVYGIAIGGLVLIPGTDAEGRPWRFDFFHAFYFVTFTGSTIGFGEIPYSFSPAQRMWTVCVMLMAVIGWLYAIGTIFALLQDAAFRRAVAESRFARQVRRQTEPFFLICGYGETGRQLVQALALSRIRAVVVERMIERVVALDVGDLNVDVPWLCANPRHPRPLLLGGVRHPRCRAVVAVAEDESENVEVGISAKLLNPGVPVVCRADSADAESKLRALRAEIVADPFDTYGERLALALRKPSVHALFELLKSTPGQPLPSYTRPPHGHWILCGYGRFGKAIVEHLRAEEDISIGIIDPGGAALPDIIAGVGSDPATLAQAGIERAVGVIAGTDDDATNLAIVSAARALRPEIYVVARQNRLRSQPLFDAAAADRVMLPSQLVVWRILTDLVNPLLAAFLSRVKEQDEAWADRLVQRLVELGNDRTPESWAVTLEPATAPAVCAAQAGGRQISIAHLLSEPRERTAALPAVALMMLRDGQYTLLPPASTPLRPGDQLLFAGRLGSAARMEWVLGNENVLEYIEGGVEYPDGYIWRYIAERRARH